MWRLAAAHLTSILFVIPFMHDLCSTLFTPYHPRLSILFDKTTMSQYKHIFWNIGDLKQDLISDDYLRRIRRAASDVQDEYPNDVIYGLGSCGDNGAPPAQISLLIPIKDLDISKIRKLVNDKLTPSVVKHLKDEFSDTDPKVIPTAELQPYERVITLDKKEQENVENYKKSFSLEKAHRLHDVIASASTKLKQPNFKSGSISSLSPAVTTQLSAIPADQLVQGFSVGAGLYKDLQAAKEDVLQTQISNLQKTLEYVAKETKGPAAAVAMATKGIVTVGKKMWDAYKVVIAEADLALELTPELVIGLITTATMGEVVAAVSALVAVIGIAAVVFKDDLNLMLLVNGKQKTLSFTEDYVKNGERLKICASLEEAPSSDAKLLAYPCTFYAYQKARVAGIAAGVFGSTVGISFTSGSAKFSIGIDCPNTIFGGDNAIRPFDKTVTAEGAANSTDGTGKTGEYIQLDGGRCDVRRAHKWGSVNYCICLLT